MFPTAALFMLPQTAVSPGGNKEDVLGIFSYLSEGDIKSPICLEECPRKAYIREMLSFDRYKEYIPSTDTITHVHEVFQLMGVLTNDYRFEEAANADGFNKEAASMCEILDRVENRGIEHGIILGEKRGEMRGMVMGREKEKIELAQKLLAGKICSEEKVSELTGLPMEKIYGLKKEIEK